MQTKNQFAFVGKSWPRATWQPLVGGPTSPLPRMRLIASAGLYTGIGQGATAWTAAANAGSSEWANFYATWLVEPAELPSCGQNRQIFVTGQARLWDNTLSIAKMWRGRSFVVKQE